MNVQTPSVLRRVVMSSLSQIWWHFWGGGMNWSWIRHWSPCCTALIVCSGSFQGICPLWYLTQIFSETTEFHPTQFLGRREFWRFIRKYPSFVTKTITLEKKKHVWNQIKRISCKYRRCRCHGWCPIANLLHSLSFWRAQKKFCQRNQLQVTSGKNDDFVRSEWKERWTLLFFHKPSLNGKRIILGFRWSWGIHFSGISIGRKPPVAITGNVRCFVRIFWGTLSKNCARFLLLTSVIAKKCDELLAIDLEANANTKQTEKRIKEATVGEKIFLFCSIVNVCCQQYSRVVSTIILHAELNLLQQKCSQIWNVERSEEVVWTEKEKNLLSNQSHYIITDCAVGDAEVLPPYVQRKTKQKVTGMYRCQGLVEVILVRLFSQRKFCFCQRCGTNFHNSQFSLQRAKKLAAEVFLWIGGYPTSCFLVLVSRRDS